MASESAISWGSISGPEAISSRQSGRGGDPSLHQEAGTGRSALGATEPLALTATVRWPLKPGPRQRSPKPLRAAQIIKPPALPGDTYLKASEHFWQGRFPV